MWNLLKEQLKLLIHHAKENTSYYQKAFNSISSIDSYDEFMKVPFLQKENIRKDYTQLLSKGTNEEDCSLYYTSGTTGIPICYVRSKTELSEASIIISKNRRKWSEQAFGGTIVYFDRIKEPLKYHFHNGRAISLALSLYNHNQERYSLYVKAIQEFKPVIIQGYASSLFQFAQYIIEQNIKMPNVQLIENRSEHLFDGQRNVIEDAFKCKIANIYGLSELFPIAYECQFGELHICIENAFVEVVSTETGEKLRDGEIGEIILTSLKCYTMPLIRYKSGDLGKIIKKSCMCGSDSPILELIKGRSNDVIKTTQGNLNPVILRRIFDHFYREQFLSIAQLQFVQTQLHEIMVNVIPLHEPNLQVENELKKLVRDCLPSITSVSVQWVQKLDQNSISGKVNTFISLIS
ncbi:phenylacetate--CoA ligase family protein [Paenibacillus yanchengensis]|uniref:Phenylacetate--CoA ligase family protein n=1 Tax=Paenibacillus yanchengensis TaxID=2035833 RepID=A0ABW4YLS1_9BACL